MTSKIVYATVKIPIEILPDGDINTLTDRIRIDFSPCEELPEASDIDYSVIMEKLMEYLTENDTDDQEDGDHIEEIAIKILKDEIKTARARPVNSTFKKRIYKHNQTAKALS